MNNYSKLAKIYDALYSFKNYEAEAKRLHEIISEKKTSPGNALLDVACGTGTHLSFLKKYYAVEGVDLTPEMLEVARVRNPEVTFHQGEMRSFDLGRRFDVVTCLFSSIGYMKSLHDLREAIINMARHLQPGGVLIIEPWLTEQTWQAGRHSCAVGRQARFQNRAHEHHLVRRTNVEVRMAHADRNSRRDRVPRPAA